MRYTILNFEYMVRACSLKIIITSLFFISLVNTKIIAQQSEMSVNDLADYYHAITLYNNKGYAVAQQSFLKLIKSPSDDQNIKDDAGYYEAMCAIKLNQPNADKKILSFVKNHPNSNKKETAFLNVANYYFANRKISHSLKWYSKVNPNLLSDDARKELHFKMGYALLIVNDLNAAKKQFKPLINDSKYANHSRYYLGYIAYKQKDYDTAENTLSQVNDDKNYKTKIAYYLLDINFKLGKFEKCIEMGEKIYPKANRKERSEISKIIGESYFNLKKYDKAIPNLRKYRGKRGRWNNTDYYQLGYAYFKQKDFQNAVNYFNKIISQKNAISQNAYYHLGDCYLKLEKKIEALNAFKNASELNFDKKIQQNAALNYVKLSYEQGNPYKKTSQVLIDYLKAYPKSEQAEQIKGLLVTSYLYQQDYQGALDYLNEHKTKKNKDLIKEISLYRATQLFNDKKFKESRPYFLTASQATDKNNRARAIYWKAEVDYLSGDFKSALKGFQSVKNKNIEESKKLNYQIAYCYFKLKKYKNAADYFQKFVNQKSKNKTLYHDAIARLGDSYYASKEYKKAIALYKKVSSKKDVKADYALYQKAMSEGLSGQSDKKIADLLSIVNRYKKSDLQDDALFELGTTYTLIKNHEKAHQAYDRLIRQFPRSPYKPEVLLRQGLLFYNQGNTEKSLSIFKNIVARYPNTKVAKQAITNAKNIYVDIGKVDQYAAWVKTISFVNVSNADLDNTTYEAAENKFLENNKPKAIEGFTAYLKNFPNGLSVLKAHFYLAELSVDDNPEKSILHYQYVVDKQHNQFSEPALNKLSQLYLKKDDWNKAKPLLVRLEKQANSPENRVYAQLNLMKLYYQNKDYQKAVQYAEKVLSSDKPTASQEQDAKIIIARSAFKTDDLATARKYYDQLATKTTGKLKAESLYYQALFTHRDKKYKESNKLIQDLIANHSSYKYWGVKSYIVMAKNYYALKDAYQATYILENIIKNFAQYEDVVAQAQNELKNIKTKEAKTNESVEPQK